MFQRGRSPRGREAVLLSPLLLTTILTALVSTVTLIVLWYIDARAAPATEPPVNDANLMVAVGFTSVAWASVVFAICRDTIMRRIDELSEQVARTASDLVEQAEQSGVFRGMAIAEEEAAAPVRVLRYPPRQADRLGLEED